MVRLDMSEFMGKHTVSTLQISVVLPFKFPFVALVLQHQSADTSKTKFGGLHICAAELTTPIYSVTIKKSIIFIILLYWIPKFIFIVLFLFQIFMLIVFIVELWWFINLYFSILH
jgi:hypothetical protein